MRLEFAPCLFPSYNLATDALLASGYICGISIGRYDPERRAVFDLTDLPVGFKIRKNITPVLKNIGWFYCRRRRGFPRIFFSGTACDRRKRQDQATEQCKPMSLFHFLHLLTHRIGNVIHKQSDFCGNFSQKEIFKHKV